MVGGRPATRNREAEFARLAGSSAEIVRLLENTARESREVFLKLKDTDLVGTRQTAGRSQKRGPSRRDMHGGCHGGMPYGSGFRCS